MIEDDPFRCFVPYPPAKVSHASSGALGTSADQFAASSGDTASRTISVASGAILHSVYRMAAAGSLPGEPKWP